MLDLANSICTLEAELAAGRELIARCHFALGEFHVMPKLRAELVAWLANHPSQD
jgi:hypothetical protein